MRARSASARTLAGAGVALLLLAGASEALAQRRIGGGAGSLDDVGQSGARAIDDLGKLGAGARRGDFPAPPPLIAPRPAPRTLSLRAKPQPPSAPAPVRAAPAAAPAPPAQARAWLNRVPPVAARVRSAAEGGARTARPARVDPAALASAGRPRAVLASAAPPRSPPIDAEAAAAQKLWREAVALGKVKGIDDLPFDELSLAARDAKLFSRTPAAFLPDPPIKPSRLGRAVKGTAYFFLGTTVITQISTAIGLPVEGARAQAAAAALRRNLLIHNSGQGRITVETRDAAGVSTVLGYVEPGASRSFSAARAAEIGFSSADRRPLEPQRIVLDQDTELRL